jgi:predicted membrane metal-binding protein
MHAAAPGSYYPQAPQPGFGGHPAQQQQYQQPQQYQQYQQPQQYAQQPQQFQQQQYQQQQYQQPQQQGGNNRVVGELLSSNKSCMDILACVCTLTLSSAMQQSCSTKHWHAHALRRHAANVSYAAAAAAVAAFLLAVVSPQFCMPQQTVLVMQEQAGFKSDDFTITDATGTLHCYSGKP